MMAVIRRQREAIFALTRDVGEGFKSTQGGFHGLNFLHTDREGIPNSVLAPVVSVVMQMMNGLLGSNFERRREIYCRGH